jgi:sigma-B regulation protein RsbU (phosphoserine phosphatase)
MTAAASVQIAPLPVHRIRCGGIWGGISVVDLDVRTAAVAASVQSTASGGERGGDIYYFSVCGGDVVTRIALADMRGHGEAVSRLSEWLYESLEARINSPPGAGVLHDLNAIVCDHGFDAMTTAAVVSYYSGDSTLSFSYAGHPPIFVRKGRAAWSPQPIENGKRLANLPLGTMRSVAYDEITITLSPGDRVFLYTDGVIECPDPDGEFYGEERLTDILERTAASSLPDVKSAVFRSLLDHAGTGEGPLVHDDCTIVVFEVSDPL